MTRDVKRIYIYQRVIWSENSLLFLWIKIACECVEIRNTPNASKIWIKSSFKGIKKPQKKRLQKISQILISILYILETAARGKSNKMSREGGYQGG